MSKSIWVVDDDPIFRLIFSMTVQKLNGDYSIKEHQNCDEVIASIDDVVNKTIQFPEFLFMDINMPGINGWECLTKIKKVLESYQGTLPSIYIISSSIDPEDERKALTHDFTKGYLSKPITIDNFKAILDQGA